MVLFSTLLEVNLYFCISKFCIGEVRERKIGGKIVKQRSLSQGKNMRIFKNFFNKKFADFCNELF